MRLVPRATGTVAVGGLHDYFGAVELRSAPDGMVVVNRLPLERYLLGLNEVPPRWPRAALEAQAIAARTYALWSLARPRAGAAAVYGFDICATDQCQVFSGADVVREAFLGDRWAAAVEATEGKAVTYGGEPILARYHSTSGGQTFANEDIFPSDGSFPYLQPVESVTEEGSPLYRWNVRFRLRRLDRILRRSDLYDRGRLRQVVTVPSAEGLHFPDVLLKGRKGVERISAEQFRVAVRVLAPQMFPNRYPSTAPTSSGRLPETLPSNRIAIATTGGAVVVTGRGWGHGVGMSQWGAEGLARRGAGAQEILSHYYTGTEIAEVADRGAIEVGVAWGLHRVSATGDFKIVDARGATVVANALGTWGFRRAGTGAVAIDPPRGFGLPLRVGIVAAPERVEIGESVPVTIALSRPARVSVADEGGSEVLGAGRRRVVWQAPAVVGDHRVTIVADDGRRKRRASTIVAVEEPAVEEAAEATPEAEEESDPPLPLAFGALALLIAVALAAGKVTMGR